MNSFNANNQDYGVANFDSQNNSNELSPEDVTKQEAILNSILDAILPWLTNFTNLLANPPSMVPMNTTAGTLDPPLGQTRLSNLFKVNTI